MAEQDRIYMRIDPDKCRSSWQCVEWLIGFIVLNSGSPARLLTEDGLLQPGDIAVIPRELEAKAVEAARGCPTKAIEIVAGDGGGTSVREPRRPIPQAPGSDISEALPLGHTEGRIDDGALSILAK
jgi:ferredoxin